ncbi:virulence protein [Mesorhizobium sp. SARCC-RB16n]|uniref:conjugal transfer ATPase VirC1 n=1 Tax=Mesorhizobium sp. SARCC-RB16n TaxID=2116687 RepID=UPI00122FA3E5|nr:conjugal transfer ATPase VirC1 [Mesorhizobium sp. SARCC-RB16n]KAA3448003.1 virulence protein [Mesorhizobium sp. SARCC-RB16n]
MKLISFYSFKGGAGKTTALMGLCSALAFKQKKIALFESDQNRPLTRWKENAIRNDAWDQACEVFVADELPLMVDAYGQADLGGFDYGLVDAHGAPSHLNNCIIGSSDYLLVPTMLTPLDIDEALATCRYIIELLMAERLQAHTAILRMRVPIGRLTVSQRAAYDILDVLPLCDTPMHERDAYAAMKERGMLHMTVAKMADDPATRRMLHYSQRALDELAMIGAFIEKTLES